jgi:hypothetical protein
LVEKKPGTRLFVLADQRQWIENSKKTTSFIEIFNISLKIFGFFKALEAQFSRLY